MGSARIPSRTPRSSGGGAILPLVVAILYGASPIDLIPDLLPLIGWLDDAVVVPLLLGIAFLRWRRARRTARSYGS